MALDRQCTPLLPALGVSTLNSATRGAMKLCQDSQMTRETSEYKQSFVGPSVVAANLCAAIAVGSRKANPTRQRLRSSCHQTVVQTPTDAASIHGQAVFEIAEISGCGFGLLAERDIAARCAVIDEEPIYVEPKDCTANESLQRFAQMSSPVRALILSMAATSGKSVREIGYSGEDLVFLRVLRCNGVAHPAGGRALYRSGCRANHSCQPNSALHVRDDGRLQLFAIRDIAAGEEITTSYLGEGELLRPASRRNKLLSHWGFQCRCPRCRGTDDTRGFVCHVCKAGTVYPSLETDEWSPCDHCGATSPQEELRKADEDWQHQATKALNDKTNMGPAIVSAMYNGMVSNALLGNVPVPALDANWIVASLAARAADPLLHSGDDGVAAVQAARCRRQFAKNVLAGVASRASAECLGVEAAVAELNGDNEAALRLFDEALQEASVLPRNADSIIEDLECRRAALLGKLDDADVASGVGGEEVGAGVAHQEGTSATANVVQFGVPLFPNRSPVCTSPIAPRKAE